MSLTYFPSPNCCINRVFDKNWFIGIFAKGNSPVGNQNSWTVSVCCLDGDGNINCKQLARASPSGWCENPQSAVPTSSSYMTTRANAWSIVVCYLNLQTNISCLSKKIQPYRLTKTCPLWPFLYLQEKFLLSIFLSMYNLINFAVKTTSESPDSPPRVLINMSKCTNLSET